MKFVNFIFKALAFLQEEVVSLARTTHPFMRMHSHECQFVINVPWS